MFSRPRALLVCLSIPLTLVGCGDSESRPACAESTEPGCGAPAPSTDGLGRHTSAIAWADGRLAAASWDTARNELVVAFYDGADTPTLRVVDRQSSHETGRFVRMAPERDGTLQLVWYDAGLGKPAWTRGGLQGFAAPEPIGDGPGIRGTHVALALDGNDTPHVAFRDETRRALTYATRTPHGWFVETIDTCAGESDCPSREDVGEWAQIALVPGVGGLSLPRIAFYDRQRGDLKLAALNEGGHWTTSTLDGRDPMSGADTGDVGRFISMATTPGRTLGLAYFDATRGALRYLGPGEAPRVIDAGLADTGPRRRVTVGQYPSLRYDTAGQAHIVYTDATTPALRHITVRAAGASPPTVLALPPGAWPALARVVSQPDGGTRLIGAFGAFGGAPHRTSLQTFALDIGGSP